MAQAESSEKQRRPPSLLREELKRAWRELRGADLSPARAAAAVALGLFIGSQPIFGCHTPLVLTICVILQLDALLAWVASNISNPFFAPFLITAEVQVGATIVTGEPIYITPDVIRESGVSAVFAYAFTGALVVGAALAVAGAILVWMFVSLKQRLSPARARAPYVLPDHAPAWWHATERVAGRYAPASILSSSRERTLFHYVRVKTLTDPVTKLIVDLLGDGPGVLGDVLDLGTGRGQIPVMMLELGRASSATGFDWDAVKIESARRAAAMTPPLPARFEVADLSTVAAPLPAADTVLLIDVIHYLTIAEQDTLLAQAATAVRPGGRLVVREADTERGWRSAMTLAEEKLFTFVGFNRGARVHFRPAKSIVGRLRDAGLVCRVEPAWGMTPFSNVLVIGDRAPGAGVPQSEHDEAAA